MNFTRYSPLLLLIAIFQKRGVGPPAFAPQFSMPHSRSPPFPIIRLQFPADFAIDAGCPQLPAGKLQFN